MNTKGLAKLYDRLTPRERLPLIMGASGRGDDLDRQRLVASAPRVSYRVPDYFGLAQAVREVSEMHFMELLTLTANYFESLGLANAEGGEEGEESFDTAMLLGYLLKVQLAGWRQFCGELDLDPELCWSCLPGYDTVRRAEKMAERVAFTPEAVAEYLRRLTSGTRRVVTADDVASGLRDCLRARAEWWG
jgi:hypothetical protein